LLVLTAPVSLLPAQGTSTASYRDMILVRNRPWAEQTFLEVAGGVIGSMPQDKDELRFAESQVSWDGHVMFHEGKFLERDGRLDVYAGKDGAYAGVTEGDPNASRGYSRLEVFGRQWGQFIREGFYQGDDFIPVGVYEHRDWQARLSFATQLSQSLRGEAFTFYGQHKFDPNSQTNPAYTLPDDYSVYGFGAIVEDNTLQISKRTNLPEQGYLLSVWITQEWNDSERLFGITGNESELPKSVLRGGAHLEWWLPHSANGTFAIVVDGAFSPEEDRLFIYDAAKPVGQIWVDGRLDYRFLLSDLISVRPGVRAQWVRIADEFATGTDDEFFFGAQAELRLDFSANFALTAWYSYLTNQSQPPVNLDEDSLGEHRAYAGFELRL
jgi:hypothetical protein